MTGVRLRLPRAGGVTATRHARASPVRDVLARRYAQLRRVRRVQYTVSEARRACRAPLRKLLTAPVGPSASAHCVRSGRRVGPSDIRAPTADSSRVRARRCQSARVVDGAASPSLRITARGGGDRRRPINCELCSCTHIYTCMLYPSRGELLERAPHRVELLLLLAQLVARLWCKDSEMRSGIRK